MPRSIVDIGWDVHNTGWKTVGEVSRSAEENRGRLVGSQWASSLPLAVVPGINLADWLRDHGPDVRLAIANSVIVGTLISRLQRDWFANGLNEKLRTEDPKLAKGIDDLFEHLAKTLNPLVTSNAVGWSTLESGRKVVLEFWKALWEEIEKLFLEILDFLAAIGGAARTLLKWATTGVKLIPIILIGVALIWAVPKVAKSLRG